MSAISLLPSVRPEFAAGAGLREQNSTATRSSTSNDSSAPRDITRVQLSQANRPATSSRIRFDQPSDTLAFSPKSLTAAARLETESGTAPDQSTPSQNATIENRPSDQDIGELARSESADEAPNADSAEGEENEENVAAPRGADGEPLSDAEVEQVRELQARDLEVRQHELAHVAAGGPYVTSGPTYQYQQGPDGKRYAVGGNVGIDVSAEDTPEKTITKAQIVRQAALAPAEPSAQDLRVAAQASQLEQQARAELSEQRREETQSIEEEESTKLGATSRQPTPSNTFDAIA